MSYICHATNELVIGEARELVPTKIRKVRYVALSKPDPRVEFYQYASHSDGWETVEEVPVRRGEAAAFAAKYPPQIVDEKEVRYLKPKPPKERFVKRSDEDNDKSED